MGPRELVLYGDESIIDNFAQQVKPTAYILDSPRVPSRCCKFGILHIRTTMATFMDLPTELHEMIIGSLGFPSNAHLKHTNHYFKKLVKPFDIYEAEKSYYANVCQLWACNDCSTLRPASQFSDKNKKGKRGKFHSEATKRFCIPCGVKQGRSGKSRYNPGDRVFVSRKLHFICKACLQFKKSPDNSRTDLCADCMDDEYLRSGRSYGEGVSKIPPSEPAITTGPALVLHPLDHKPNYLDLYEWMTYAPQQSTIAARLRDRETILEATQNQLKDSLAQVVMKERFFQECLIAIPQPEA
jgi:hypothetical protein